MTLDLLSNIWPIGWTQADDVFFATFQGQPVNAWATTVGTFTCYNVHVGKHPNLVAGRGPDAMVVVEDVRLLALAHDGF